MYIYIYMYIYMCIYKHIIYICIHMLSSSSLEINEYHSPIKPSVVGGEIIRPFNAPVDCTRDL